MTQDQKHLRQVQSDANWLKGNVSSLGLKGFHGKIVLHYEKGRLISMVEERRHKPPSV